MRRKALMSAAATLALALTACGGGGNGGGVNWNPPPPPPSPTPTPTPPAVPFGVTSDTLFVTAGDDADLRWNHSAQAYEIRLPDSDWERLEALDSSPTYQNHYPSSGMYGLEVRKDLEYRYTNLATVFENGWGTPIGQFAYGIPTAQGDVPTTGSATYQAMVLGDGSSPGTAPSETRFYTVSGTAQLNFNFGAGTLSGHMLPILTGSGTTVSLPRYDFSQTVFGVGSTTFSGQFAVPGTTADSFFRGSFTGPGAAELAAEWQAPFQPVGSSNVWGTMKGLWIGKKGD